MVNLPHLDNVLPLARLLQNATKTSQIKQFIIKYLQIIICQSKLLRYKAMYYNSIIFIFLFFL